MGIIDNIIRRASVKKTKIVLPEYMDERVMKAASIILDKNIADIIIIGNKDKLGYCDDIILNNATIIDPINSDLTNEVINIFYNIRKNKGISLSDAKDMVLNDYMYYACCLVKLGYADGVVSGACHSSSDTIRPALQIIKNSSKSSIASAFFLMEVDNFATDREVFVFADCGLNQKPTADELSMIAKDSADSFKLLVEKEPKVAMLSYSTNGSAQHADVNKVFNAYTIAKAKYTDLIIDGELQLDAAIIPEVAKIKSPDSSLKGQANVLIFPDLNSGNIGYKLVERFAHAKAYGPICQGINNPVNDLSRGASIDDIVGVIAITALQAQKKENN